MEKLFTSKGFNAFILLIDLIIIYLSTFLTYLCFKSSLDAYESNLYAFISISPYIGLFYLIIGHIFELDKPKEFTFFGVAYAVVLSIACLFMLTMAMSFLTRKFAYPRSILIVSSIVQIILLTLWHLYINKKYLKDNIKKTVLVVGYNKAKEIARKLLLSKGMWTNIKHICTPDAKNLNSYIESCDVIFLSDDVDESQKQNIAEYCIGKQKDFFYEPKYQEIFLFNTNLAQIGDAPILKVRPFGANVENNFTKRVLDIILSFIAIIIFFIPFLCVTIALKIGGGSALYKQERVTLHGRIFYIYKFRTMIENAEALSGPTLAQEADKRITKLGHFLRATRLDEIPQLYNILKGDMSIVGPRPERPFFVEQFSKEIPEYNLRHSVKAGLTGLAQVQGKYNTPVWDKLKYDLLYINGYSFTLDFKLIMQTLNILLKKSSTEGLKEFESNEELIDRLTDKN
jgi:exopolysaccharide biosynthesis polyprenyl glycosylphosphotransferase